MVSFAVGALLGGAFVHIIPHSVESMGFNLRTSLLILSGIFVFFILEKFLRWRHCHVHDDHHVHPYAYANLVGDGMHNFVDGILIASCYLTDIELGIATTIAVLLHEIPQELSDFCVLIHGGFSVKKALVWNLVSAMMAVVGAVLVIAIPSQWVGLTTYLLPVTAGGFIYIAGCDLIPELHHHNHPNDSLWQFIWIGLGTLFMVILELGPLHVH